MGLHAATTVAVLAGSVGPSRGEMTHQRYQVLAWGRCHNVVQGGRPDSRPVAHYAHRLVQGDEQAALCGRENVLYGLPVFFHRATRSLTLALGLTLTCPVPGCGQGQGQGQGPPIPKPCSGSGSGPLTGV